MARKRMVTRTITSTKATVTVYNIEKDEIQTVEYKMSGELSTDAVIKVIEKEHNEVRPLKVTEVTVQESFTECQKRSLLNWRRLFHLEQKFLNN